jgi:hypothetical protein
MDNPKTRKDKKKNQDEKSRGPNGVYNQKYVRKIEERINKTHK